MNDAVEQAVLAVQQGDTRAFGTLYDRYVRQIYKFIYIKTYDKETTEDITSLTFTKALEHLKTFDLAKGTFQSWLYGIARNAVTDHYRKVRPTVPLDDVWDLRDNGHIEQDTDGKIKLERVKEYLEKLSAGEREIILMRVWGEMSYHEIAAALGKSEDGSKMSYSRAIRKLRELMPLAAYLAFILQHPHSL